VVYIKVAFEKVGTCYQEVDNGHVVRYVDENGVELFVQPPIGESSSVSDAKATPTPAMISASAARAALAWDGKTERRLSRRRLIDA
jgi:hypothetical protein